MTQLTFPYKQILTKQSPRFFSIIAWILFQYRCQQRKLFVNENLKNIFYKCKLKKKIKTQTESLKRISQKKF